MTIIYEVNPPKITQNAQSSEELDGLLEKLKKRVSEIASNCDGIHITDSVLGTLRVSAIATGLTLRKDHPNLQITISMRVRDKNLDSVIQYVDESIQAGLDGVLVLKGDPSPDSLTDSGLIPSQVVKHLKDNRCAERTKLFLSLPSNPNFDKIQKKINAQPTGFMTQVIHSVKQVSRICDELKPKGFRIMPCVLLPSEKNVKSAEFLKLDWSSYKYRVDEFIKEVHNIAGDVLITSPNDFSYAKEVLRKL